MKRDNYIFRREWLDYMSELDPSERMEVREAIDLYALQPILKDNHSRLPHIVFGCIKSSIDRANDAYKATVERNRENGRQGGRPRRNPQKPTETPNNPQNPVGYSETQENPQKPTETLPDSCILNPDIDRDYYYSARPCAREDGVSESDPCVISKEEEKEFFEIFFFKNFLDPWKQTERFIAHNSARGWTGDRGAVFDTPQKRASLARLWEQKDAPPGSARFPKWFIDAWKNAYAIAKDGELRNAEVADEMLSRTVSAETGINLKDRRINCGKSFGMWYKEHEDILSPIFRGIQIYVKK